MKFAISLFQSRTGGQSERTIYCESLEQTRLAEALGFHAVWLTEQHFNDFGVCPDPLLFATHLAGATREIRLGTAVVLLSIHNPVVLAERAALLDQLSEGRLDLGIGKGHARLNFAAFGIQSDENEARFYEAHDLMKAAWTGEELSFHGRFYSAERIRLVPRPFQSPHPPLWVASFGHPNSIGFAARNGYPLIHSFSGDGFRKNMELYRSEYRGASTPTMAVARAVHLHADGEMARQEMAAPIRWFIDNNPSRPAHILSYELAVSEFIKNIGIIGSVEECIEGIRRLQQEHQVEYLACIFGQGGLEHQKILRAMRLFAEKVMPEFAD
jgi:alkanesulfonate monooxygenase SsuD/methylene tetrahydromethanopterin reductase-like flavin-dependent oxidoreductase (luciferase family)